MATTHSDYGGFFSPCKYSLLLEEKREREKKEKKEGDLLKNNQI